MALLLMALLLMTLLLLISNFMNIDKKPASLQVGNQTSNVRNLHNDVDVTIEREALFLVHEGWQESVFSVQIVYSSG